MFGGSVSQAERRADCFVGASNAAGDRFGRDALVPFSTCTAPTGQVFDHVITTLVK